MSLDYKITPLPLVWPGKATPAHQRVRAPFKTIETRALTLLGREIGMLGGRNVEIAVDVEPRHLRQDGQLRADARPRSSAVVVSFDVRDGRLQFPADRFAHWWANVDAIARALEDLRRVDRYGVQQGRQYTGFKAIPASTGPTLTAAQAADVIARRSGNASATAAILQERAIAKRAVTLARAKTHPDANDGARDTYDEVDAAAQVLVAHYGGSL